MPTLIWRMLESLPKKGAQDEGFPEWYEQWFCFGTRRPITVKGRVPNLDQRQTIKENLSKFVSFLSDLRAGYWNPDLLNERGRDRIYAVYCFALCQNIRAIHGPNKTFSVQTGACLRVLKESAEIRDVSEEIVNAMWDHLKKKAELDELDPTIPNLPIGMLCSDDNLRIAVGSLPTGRRVPEYSCRLPISPALVLLIGSGNDVTLPGEYRHLTQGTSAEALFDVLKKYESGLTLRLDEFPSATIRVHTHRKQVCWSVFFMHLEFLLQELTLKARQSGDVAMSSGSDQAPFTGLHLIDMLRNGESSGGVEATPPEERIDRRIRQGALGTRSGMPRFSALQSGNSVNATSILASTDGLDQQESGHIEDIWELPYLAVAVDDSVKPTKIHVTLDWLSLRGADRYALHVAIVRQGAGMVVYPRIEFEQWDEECDDFNDVCIAQVTAELRDSIIYHRSLGLEPVAFAARRPTGSGVDVYLVYREAVRN